ncbi:MAG TPA: type II toxin-antitoxin system RelE/ParE family toxin [Pyrinomonadaceae bacterium]|jgi:proteic killer suppression protein|nr:type II toxin-antitoxin system RelE/ParE family toxin [Pyrinomonadaceae bacterium]
MIRTFRHKGLKQLFEVGKSHAVSADLARKLIRQLDLLNRAASLMDMNLPGYRLHELKGERKGTWSVSVSGNWRLTFKFQDGDAYDADLEDYH